MFHEMAKSQKVIWETSKFMDVHSSDIGIPYELGSKYLLQQKITFKKSKNGHLCILGHMK